MSVVDSHTRLRQDAVDAVMALLQASAAPSLLLPVADTDPPLYIVAGEAAEIRRLLASPPLKARPQPPVAVVPHDTDPNPELIAREAADERLGVRIAVVSALALALCLALSYLR